MRIFQSVFSGSPNCRPQKFDRGPRSGQLAMARCLYQVLLYSDDDDGAMHADVVQVMARLVRETVSRLEGVKERFGQRSA